MENPGGDVVESRPELTALGPSTASTIDRLPLVLCWGGLVLFAVSLVLPALRLQPKGEWVAGESGYICLVLSFDAFPRWVPHALLIAAPFICTFAGATAKKATGIVLTLTTVSVLEWCIPEVVNIGFGQGVLAGFWIWALALVTSTAGLLIGGFLPGPATSALGASVERLVETGHRQSQRSILLCWSGLALVIGLGLTGWSSLFLGAGPRPVAGTGFLLFVAFRFVVPTMLAMAPLMGTYASRKTQMIMALGLLTFGLYQIVSYWMFFADAPGVAVLHAHLSSWLTAGMSVAGLLVSAGLPRAAALAGLHSADFQRPGSKEATSVPTLSSGRARLGATLCWMALANALGLCSLPFAFMRGSENAGSLIASLFFNPYLSYSVLAMAPLVCAVGGPLARRSLGALLAFAMVSIVLLIVMTPIGLHGLPDLIAFGLAVAGLLSVDVWRKS
jgi:hypothetical protein